MVGLHSCCIRTRAHQHVSPKFTKSCMEYIEFVTFVVDRSSRECKPMGRQSCACKEFFAGGSAIHTGLSEEQVWWFRTQLCIFAICHREKHHVLPRPFASLLSFFILQRVRLLSSFRSQQLTADLYNQACRPHAQRHRSYSDGRLSFCSASRFPPRSLHLEPSKGVFHNSLVSWQSDAQVACTHHFLSPWAQVPGPPLSTLGISPSLFSRRNPAHLCMSVSDSVVL